MDKSFTKTIKTNNKKPTRINDTKFFTVFPKEISIYDDIDFVSKLTTKQIHEEERKLFKEYHKLQDLGFSPDSKECKRISKKILDININGIVWLARKYYANLISKVKDEWEVINLVCIGVAESIPKYRDIGGAFLTYATYQVKHVINNFVYSDRGLSAYHSKGTFKLDKAEMNMIEKYGTGERTLHEYEEETGMSPSTICKMDNLRNISATISMEEEGVTESIKNTFLSPEVEIIKKEEEETLFNSLKKLSPQTQQVLLMYFGFDDKQYSYVEISKLTGIPVKKIKNIINNAIMDLRDDEDIKKTYLADDTDIGIKSKEDLNYNVTL